MSERAYTVAEIDALRRAVINKHFYSRRAVFGNDGKVAGYALVEQSDRSVADVEEYVRTYMLAGLTADDAPAAKVE